MKEIAKHKTLGKINSTSEPTGEGVNPLKKFTIPKIRRTAGKVYLSTCHTSTREYSFIHDVLNQCRLDISCDLQSLWQFGDTKLVHNEDLEKNFTSKRSEMRESGRHGRELEEHFCFLALPQSDVAEIYQNGISTKASKLKILGNPLLGIYVFRHVDVALNYAHTRSITIESIIIFKVLFGRVKKIQPSVDKKKVSLDPSPNFDCHMSRSIPSLKDTTELQAYSSAVYFYEYNVLSKPVDKPRQCLPYAIVTVKFIGQKGDNGPLMTSLRVLSTGLPKRAGRTCSLNNCTVAKRIGKGKDATVIFEHFRKPIDPFVQENSSCSALHSEIKPSNSDNSNSYGNVQNGNISIYETYSGQMEHNLMEYKDTSQVHACDSGLSFIPSDTSESVSGDPLLSLTHHKGVLSGLSAAFTLHNNTGSSTVITSKLIKDPRLLRREESMRKHNNADLNEILPSEKSLDFVNSEINPSMPTNSTSSSEIMPGHHAILTNCLDSPLFKISFDDSQSQAHNMGSKNYNYTTPNKITKEGQCQSQDSFSFPLCLSNVSEVENQKHSEEKAQRSQQRSNIPLLTEENSEPQNSYESVNTFTKGHNSHISQESQSSNVKTLCQTGQHTPTFLPFQRRKSIHEYIQNTGKLRNFTGPEDNSKHGKKQNLWKETDDYCTNETKISLVDSSISLHQEYKQDESLDCFGKKCDQVVISQDLQITKSPPSTTKDKYEPDYLALELQNDFTTRVESLSQKHSQHPLEYEDNIHTYLAISQKLMELKLKKSNQNCVGITTDTFQEAKDIPQTKQLPVDTVFSSHDIKTAYDNSNCSIAREHIYIDRKNENDSVSLEYIQRDCKETPQIDDKGEDHTLFCNAQLNNDIYLNNDFKEHSYNDKENKNEAKEEDIASATENNIDSICRDEKQGFHTDKNFTNIDERENKYSVEILNSDEFSTFNLTWGGKSISTETVLLETEDSITAIKQKDTQNTGRIVNHLASIFPKIAGYSVHVASNAAVQIAETTVPALSINEEDHQRYQFKETCSSQSPDFGLLVKHGVSDFETDMDKNKLHDSFYQSISDNSVLQSFELENEIEGGPEQCDDALLFQQDTHSHGNILYEESEASYEALKSRIDWEGLFGSNNGQKEVPKSTTRRENSDQHYPEENNCFYSSTQKDKTEFFKPVLLPDLQVRIINNIFMPGFSSPIETLALKDNFCCITEATKSEINEEEGRVLGFEIYSHSSGENSHHPCEDELDNVRQESGLVSNSEVSPASEKKNSGPLLIEPSNITISNESRCSFTKSKTDCNDTKSKKNSESRTTKRKPYTPFRDQNIPHNDLRHEVCDKRRRLTNQNSLECFSSLSKGLIKTCSQSEKHIRSVLGILNSKLSICKSKHLSIKLDRSVLPFKNDHRRVHTSLQLIAKVGEKSKGLLPKSYAITCNNFLEICDLQGYGSVSGRRYDSTKHFLSRRKYKPGMRRALAFEADKSLTRVSKYKTGCRFLPEHPDEKLTKNENQINIKSSSNIRKFEKLENYSAPNNNEDAIKENAEASEIINKSNSVTLSCLSENNTSFSTGKNYVATCVAHTEVKTDIVISTVESNVKHFLNGDIYKQDNLTLSGYKRNLEVNFPLEKWTASIESPRPGTITENVLMDPLNLTLITSKRCNSIPQLLSVAPVTNSKGESSKSYLDKQRSFAIDSFAASINIPHDQQGCGGKQLLKTEQCSPSSCFHIGGNEIHVIENSELDLIPVTEESKSYGENTMKRLFSNDSSLLLKGNIKSSSKKYVAKKDIQDRKILKVKQTEKAKDSVHKKSMNEGSTVKTEYRNQNKILGESSYLSEKIIKNNLTNSVLNIKNTTEAISSNNTVSNQLNKRERERAVKVSDDSQSDSILPSEIACNSKPGVIGMNNMPTVRAHSETSKVTTQKPTPYMNELKEKHCAAYHSGLLARLAHILRRADKASSLQNLQEETKVCQNILPLFVEAFERKQECSLEQILISRELLVKQNLWNNYKHKLKPCAVDSLVELQMVMETIQFIENKKRLLEGEPTFRSLLWYDETLYSELLGRPRGFQQQSNFYSAFQGRLKYNAFCELQNYHDQLIKLFEETKRENSSYYAFLKYKRQINECEAILKHCSDCFDFSLSVPFTCGVNFGDSLGDLETLRKSTLKLVSMYEYLPKVDSYPGKKDHLWIIIEMISSKVSFIKSSEAVGINISLFGLEHIFFDAAKSLVWEEKRESFSKTYPGHKNIETLLKMNQYSFSKLQKIYGMLSKDLSSEQIPDIGLENAMIASRKSDDLTNNKATICIENRFSSTLLSHPDICCVSEILDQAEFADFKKLQGLTLRCTDHLEILKKYFHLLQEDNRSNIFITEENVLDMVKNHNHQAIILKPAAIETYIEIAMLSETVHFLKNSMSKKQDKPRFRGMLWFDLSLLPELVQCQEKMASFSYLKSNPTDCLWEVIETSISEVQDNLDIAYQYNEAVNRSYALHLFSRELEELEEIKNLLMKSKYSVSTYIDFVPYIASVNYGSTVMELECNYNQFSTLLKNKLAAPRRDLGKVAHIIKVMKTIEYMKIICAKNAELTISFILYQMLHNKKTFQLKRKEKMNVHVKRRKSINKSSTCMKEASDSECMMKNVSNSSKKRPVTVDKCEDCQEQEKNTTVSSCKKQKVNVETVTKISREKTTLKHPRTTRSHPKSVSEVGPNSSDNLKRDHVSPKKVEMQRSLPGSTLPLRNLKDTCTLKSEGNTDSTNISSGTSEDFTRQRENLNRMKKRDVNFSAVVFERQDNEMLNSSIKNSTYTNSPEPIFLQNKIPDLQISETQPAKTESKEKDMKDRLNPNSVPVETSENITRKVDQTAEYSFYEQQNNENSKVLTQNASTYWNEHPQSAYTPIYNSSEHSFGTSYPYYSWCVYHYSNNNGSSITQTYQGIASYEVQPPPPEMLTTVPSTVQNTHSNLLYTQCFSYFSQEPQAYSFVPANGYFPPRMPVSYNFQQPAFSQYASYQQLPQVAYPYRPNSRVFPEVPWTYVPWQHQEPFQPGH